MTETPETLPYGNYLPDVYRFAFLMTGHADVATDVLRHTVVRAARERLDNIRDPFQAKRWLFAEARTLCAHPPAAIPRGETPLTPVPSQADDASAPDAAARPELPSRPVPDLAGSTVPDDPPRQLAMLFADLPADERGALILFYLFLFDPAELAELLGIRLTELGPLLRRGRTLLQRHGPLCESLFAAGAPPAPDEAVVADAA